MDYSPLQKISSPKNPKRLPVYMDKKRIDDIFDLSTHIHSSDQYLCALADFSTLVVESAIVIVESVLSDERNGENDEKDKKYWNWFSIINR